MSSKHIPYFKFFPSDFMHGVRGLSAQDVGVYTMLLCRIYEENGPVEFNIIRLSTYCGMRETTFKKTVEKLIELGKIDLSNSMISNRRAMEEISSRANDLKNKSKGGKTSAEKRQQNQSQTSTAVQQKSNYTDTDTDITSSLRSDVKAHAPEKPSVKSELMKVLDADHAQAVIEHRRAIKKAMTPRAAHLLAAEFSKCPDANAAADTMIANGWQGFKAEWFANVSAPRGHAPPGQSKPVMMADLTGALMRQMTDRRDDEPDSENRSTIETSYSGGNHGTSAPAFRLTAPEGRR